MQRSIVAVRVELGYLGDVFARPSGIPLPWFEEGADPNADLWATADERREDVVELYRRAWAHGDATVHALDLDAEGTVPWWGDRGRVTLHLILVHLIAETNRHAGHADVLRESIDGLAGLRRDGDNLGVDERGWQAHRDAVEAAARAATGREDAPSRDRP